MCTIIQDPNPVLHETALPVPPAEISSATLQKLIRDMKTALKKEPDGVALAAPQVGSLLRIFVVAGFVFDMKKKNITGTKSGDRVFINPEITKKSKETTWISGEGCLSVRWKYGTAKRHKKVSVRAQDETGTWFTLQTSGLLAQIVQHEIDHLNGILFTDHAKNIHMMSEEEIKDYQEELAQISHE